MNETWFHDVIFIIRTFIVFDETLIQFDVSHMVLCTQLF